MLGRAGLGLASLLCYIKSCICCRNWEGRWKQLEFHKIVVRQVLLHTLLSQLDARGECHMCQMFSFGCCIAFPSNCKWEKEGLLHIALIQTLLKTLGIKYRDSLLFQTLRKACLFFQQYQLNKSCLFTLCT